LILARSAHAARARERANAVVSGGVEEFRAADGPAAIVSTSDQDFAALKQCGGSIVASASHVFKLGETASAIVRGWVE
jgi:hypothetical protein